MAEWEETSSVFEHEITIPGLLALHRDGTITRFAIPQGELDVPPSTNSKDLLLTAHRKARLFLPTTIPTTPASNIKLPLILFFHGGGFVSSSYASPDCHRLCNELATKTHAIVLSVSYRLAPEHRLPAAFEDGFSALLWLKGQALCEPNSEPWLASYADFTKVFIAGVSSGASIVHQVALQAATQDLKPLDLRGLVLVVPFFGGHVRTQSEVELEKSSTLPLQGCKKCWALSLPKGANRDHPFSNVMGPQARRVDNAMTWPPSLVVFGGRDILHDRQLEYAQQLQAAGKEVKVARFEQGDHFMSGQFHDLMVEEITYFVLNHS